MRISPPKASLLIYDGECPLCQRARAWIEQHVPLEVLRTIPCQDERRPALAPTVTTEDCMAAMQLVMPDGRVFSGERAFPHILRMTRYGRFIAWLFYLPGTRWVYQRIARNRLAISGLLVRKEQGDSCSIDKGCK